MTDGWGSKVKWGDRHSLASVAGVSDRVIARKLEREQKKKKKGGRGRGRREEETCSIKEQSNFTNPGVTC